MNDTPLTDKRLKNIKIENEDSCCSIYVYVNDKEYTGDIVDADFARGLERENQLLKSALKDVLSIMDKLSGNYQPDEDSCLGNAFFEMEMCEDSFFILKSEIEELTNAKA